jgi:7-cyano-7-deazaguanine reductase
MLLGQNTSYQDIYDKNILEAIPRKNSHFNGYDLWNLYELSWLLPGQKPVVAIGRLIYDAKSQYIVESKSLKLYLNSFNNRVFNDKHEIRNCIIDDLQNILKTNIILEIYLLDEQLPTIITHLDGISIDSTLNNEVANRVVDEILISNLLRSNCPVTNQPDWGSLQVQYKGPQINREWLLNNIISYRKHQDFHESCIEQIYNDIWSNYNLDALTVRGFYTRRGGIDINPMRTSGNYDINKIKFYKLIRQ